MSRALVALLLAIVTTTLAAQRTQVLPFGQPAPLTDTHYAPVAASGSDAKLVTSGIDTFAFWSRDGLIRATRIDDQRRVAKPLHGGAVVDFDVIWTGEYFLVAAQQHRDIVLLLVDRSGEAVGGFVKVGTGGRPRLVANARAVMVVYHADADLVTMRLSHGGRPLSEPRMLAPAPAGGTTRLATNGETFAAAESHGSGTTMLVFDEAGRVLATRSLGMEYHFGFHPTAGIGTNGTNYLVVVQEQQGTTAYSFSPGGTLLHNLRLDDQIDFEPQVLGNGSGYTVVYNRLSNVNAATVYDDEGRLTAGPLTTRMAGRVRSAVAAPAGLLVATAGNGRSLDIFDLAGTAAPVAISYGAGHQQLLATVEAGTSRMVFWNELSADPALRVGIIDSDGKWSEREVGPAVETVAGASDGNDVVLLAAYSDRRALLHLDRGGRLLRTTPLDDARFTPRAIVWSGTDYVLAGSSGSTSAATVARVTRTGVLGTLVPVGVSEVHPAAIASNGNGFLVVWDGAYQGRWISAHRADLALHQTPAMLAAGSTERAPVAVWNGADYITAWTEGQTSVMGRIVNPAGSMTPPFLIRTVLANHFFDTLSAARQGSNVIVGWAYAEGSGALAARLEAIPVHATGSVGSVASWDIPAPPSFLSGSTASRIAVLHDGTVAWIGSRFESGAPYHGMTRLLVRKAGPTAPPAVPDAPVVSMRRFSGQLRVEWTAPQQVDSYRLEYRVGQGAWLEMPRQYDRDDLVASWTTVRHGETYSFRVRAANAGGIGAYSEPATITIPLPAGKRRAVR